MSDVQLLLIEPDEGTARTIAQILRERWQGDLKIMQCGSADDALRILGRAQFDAVLATVPGPPDAAIRIITELVQTSGVPILAMGNVAEREIGLTAIRAGAEDYLLKQEALYPALPRILQYSIERRTLSERYRVMGDRRNEIESLLSGVLEVIGSAVAIVDQHGRVVAVNRALTNAFGWTMRDLAGRSFAEFTAPAQGNRPAQVQHKDRTSRPVRLSSTTVQINGQPCQVFAYEPPDGAPHAGGPVSFEQRFSALVKSQPERLVAGRLQVVNLDAVRQELGDRWERSAEKFYETSEKVLRARLSAEDVFTRNNSGQFIICFAELSEGDAWFKAQAIQKEIQDKLIGERVDPLLANIRVETHAIEISAEEKEADDIAGLIARKLAREAELLKREADQLLSEILRSGGLAPRPVLDARERETGLLICEFDRETQAKLDRIAIAHENDPKIIGEIDALLLGRAAEHIRDAAFQAHGKSLVVRLHFPTIYNRQPREKYLGICRQLPVPVRKALGFVVHGIPEDILPVRVTELLGILRPFAPMRLVHLERPSLGNINLRDAHIQVVSIDASSLRTAFDGPAVEKFMGQLRNNRCRLLVDRLSDAADAKLARAIGAEFMADDRPPGTTAPSQVPLPTDRRREVLAPAVISYRRYVDGIEQPSAVSRGDRPRPRPSSAPFSGS